MEKHKIIKVDGFKILINPPSYSWGDIIENVTLTYTNKHLEIAGDLTIEKYDPYYEIDDEDLEEDSFKIRKIFGYTKKVRKSNWVVLKKRKPYKCRIKNYKVTYNDK